MLVTAEIFTTPIEAHIVCGRLEAEGIPAFVIHEHHIWAYWFVSNALGGVKVQVSSSDLSAAVELLETLDKGEFELLLAECEGPFDPLVCPKCNSHSIMECRWNEKISLFILWAYAIPIPYIQGKLRCSDCGYKWLSKARKSYPVFARLSAIFLYHNILYIFNRRY